MEIILMLFATLFIINSIRSLAAIWATLQEIRLHRLWLKQSKKDTIYVSGEIVDTCYGKSTE